MSADSVRETRHRR